MRIAVRHGVLLVLFSTLFAIAASDAQEQDPGPRGWLGFRFCHYEAPSDEHEGWIEVSEVAPASPAAEAGLKTGDLITAINGRPLRFWAAEDVARFFRSRERGVLLVLRIRRATKTKKIEIRVAPPPSGAPDREASGR